jgi:predicted house-cleaning noncanonical NTP pyrophosphatase (MazG superfamily)
MENLSWRVSFTELCEEVFRELGFDSPAMLHDDNLPLAMEIQVESRNFELIHSATDRPHQILILCKLQESIDELSRDEYEAMLASNLTQIRQTEAYFGITADEQEIVWILTEPLTNLRAGQLLEKLRAMADSSQSWRNLVQENKAGETSVTDGQGVMLA